MTRLALLATALVILVGCNEGGGPTTQASPSPTPMPGAACASATEGCLVVEVDETKGDRLYINFVKYGLPEGPPSLARPIRLSPGARYARKMPPGQYGLLVYRQKALPSAGEGPECQLNFPVKKHQRVVLVVDYADGGGCAVTSRAEST